MRIMSTDELRRLEVINLCGGERLGFPCELEFDVECAKIISMCVFPESRGILSWGNKEEYIVPWCKIECIGEDAILVKLSDAELSSCIRGRIRKKRR